MAQASTRVKYYRSIRTVTGWTILFMVLLRVAIGWHFFYEGWSKINSGGKFSATPYLMASVGPFKDVFHAMVDDMDGTKKRLVSKDYLYAQLDDRLEAIKRFYGVQDEKLVQTLQARQAKGEKLSAEEQATLDRELQKLTPAQIESLEIFVERKKHGVPDDNTVEALFNDENLFLKEYRSAGEQINPRDPAKPIDLSLVVLKPRPEKRDEIVKRIEGLIADLDATVRKAVTDPLVSRDAPPDQKKTLEKPVPPVTIVPPGTADDDVSWITRDYVEKLIDDRYNVLKAHYELTEHVQHQSKYGWRYRDQKKRGHHDKNNIDHLLADPDFQKAFEDYQALLVQIEEEENKDPIQFNKQRYDFNVSKATALRNDLLKRFDIPMSDVDLQKIQHFSEYIGPIKDITPEQLARGPVPSLREQQFPGNLLVKAGVDLPKRTLTYWQDLAMMLGLTAVGACLILGLFTRFAAVVGAIMLLMFYLAMPPFPGVNVPANAAEGHYLFVNKNLIEMIALLMIAFSGIGRWFGIDAFIHAIFGRRTTAVEETTAPAGEAGATGGPVFVTGTRPPVRERDGSRA